MTLDESLEDEWQETDKICSHTHATGWGRLTNNSPALWIISVTRKQNNIVSSSQTSVPLKPRNIHYFKRIAAVLKENDFLDYLPPCSDPSHKHSSSHNSLNDTEHMILYPYSNQTLFYESAISSISVHIQMDCNNLTITLSQGVIGFIHFL